MKAPQFCECVGCGFPIVEGVDGVLYDEYRNQYFCDEGCFEQWFDHNLESIRDEYKYRNVEKVDT